MREPLSYQQFVERALIKNYKGDLYSKFMQALIRYEMIKPGDKVAVAISGGKDSLVLAKLFQEFKRHGNIDFELVFLTMDPGFLPVAMEKHLDTCRKLGIDIVVEPSDVFEVNRKMGVMDSPCFLCARMRRGVLYKLARKHGCNKLALGHHMDDVIETTILNMFYEGRYQTMMPKIRSENYEGIELIRPMYYIKESDIVRFANYCHLEPIKCGCPISDGEKDTKRKEIKRWIAEWRKTEPNIDINIFRSAENVNLKCVLRYHDDDHERTFLDDY